MTKGEKEHAVAKKNIPEFILPPPIVGNWKVVNDALASTLFARFAEYGFPGSDHLQHPGSIRVLELPFWPGWFLCDIEPAHPVMGPPSNATEEQETLSGNPLSPPRSDGEKTDNVVDLLQRREAATEENIEPGRAGAVYSYVYGPDGFLELSGSSSRVHGHNAHHGIVLDEPATRAQYLRFFCYFVRGDAGPFEIVEALDDVAAMDGASQGLEVAPVRELPDETRDRKDGATVLAATVVYSNTLFNAQFAIKPDGMIEMLDDTPLRENVTALPRTEFRGAARFAAQQSGMEREGRK